MLKNLLEKAALSVSSVEVAGETVQVREPTFLQMRDFYEASEKGVKRDALIKLFADCLVNEDGSPAATLEEAGQLVDGKRDIFVTLLNAITKPLEKGEAKND